MGCTSSREHVKSRNKSKGKMVAPELIPENHLMSKFTHTHEAPKLDRRSFLPEVQEIFPHKHAALPKHKHDTIPYRRRRSEETVANFVRENKSPLPKIRTFSESTKLSSEPQVIDIGELMAGLEDAADPCYSNFRIRQTNKTQITHNRSLSLSVFPSYQNSKSPADLESSNLRHSVSRAYHQRVKSHSPVGDDYELQKFSTSPESERETVFKDLVTVIMEVVGSPADIKSSSEGMIRKKLFDDSAVGDKDSSKDSSKSSEKLRKSEVSSEETDSSAKATNQRSHGSKTISSALSFDMNSSTGNFLADYEILCQEAMDEFSFNNQVLHKKVPKNKVHYDLEADMNSEKTTVQTLLKDTSSVGSSTWFPSIPWQSINSLNLNDFEKLSPPRGENRVVLYATSSYENRKTYEECSLVRQILHSYKIDLDERDILLHSELDYELQQILNSARTVSVPRLFIKGRHIGGVEEVCLLHKANALERLLRAFSSEYIKALCVCCGGKRTIQCLGCNGMCWLKTEENDVIPCQECEKKGWIMCPICS